jgi:hypothetical protein
LHPLVSDVQRTSCIRSRETHLGSWPAAKHGGLAKTARSDR